MTYAEIVYTKSDHVATVTLNRPERLNGMGLAMEAEIVAALDDAWRDDDVRALVITGSGKAFCAGGNAKNVLTDIIYAPGWQARTRRNALGRKRVVNQTLMGFDKPIIAAVNGIAAGAGLAMALIADIRIASPDARFGNIYMRRGTVPNMAPYWLPRSIGLGDACWMIFGDEIFDAADALRVGLIDHIVSHERFADEIREMAVQLAAAPPAAARLSKWLIRRTWDFDYDTVRRVGLLATVAASAVDSAPTTRLQQGGDAVVAYDVVDGTASIVVGRADGTGARSATLADEIFDMIRAADEDERVRVIVLSGLERWLSTSSPRAAPGADARQLFQVLNVGTEREHPFASPDSALRLSDKPTIAVLDGDVAGEASDLGLLCDLRIASVRTRIGANGCSGGAVSGIAAHYLPRLVGAGIASEMILGGRMLTAENARRLGLITDVVPVERLDTCTRALVARLGAKPVPEMRFARRMLQRSSAPTPLHAKEYALVYQSLSLELADEQRETLARAEEPLGDGFEDGGSRGVGSGGPGEAHSGGRVVYETDDRIATITLDAPGGNALDAGMRERIVAALQQAKDDDEIRVIVIAGAGSDFCAGEGAHAREARIRETRAERIERLRRIRDMDVVDALISTEKPTMASLRGLAAGEGASLVLGCDVRVAAESARFALSDGPRSEVSRATHLLVRSVGLGEATRLLLLGDEIDAAEAGRIGFVQMVVSDAELEHVTRQMAMRIANGPKMAMRVTKRALYRGLTSSADDAYGYTTALSGLLQRNSDETNEGFRSFVEKRPPRF